MIHALSFSKIALASLSLVSLLFLAGCASGSQSAGAAQNDKSKQEQSAQNPADKPAPQSASDNGNAGESKNSGWLTYTNKPFNFAMNYPDTFALKPTKLDGLVPTVATIEYPESYTKGTNLGYAKVNLKASEDAGTGKCLVSEVTGQKLTEKVINNGITFYKDSEKDGAAGHVGETLAYHTVHNGICYVVNLEEYYTNMDMYADGKGGYTPNAPKEFEPVKISSIFDQMFTTFAFTK